MNCARVENLTLSTRISAATYEWECPSRRKKEDEYYYFDADSREDESLVISCNNNDITSWVISHQAMVKHR